MAMLTSCPFCTIAHTYPPFPPTTFLRLQNSINTHNNDDLLLNIVPPTTVDSTTSSDSIDSGQAHLILSTPHVLAFLDIMPLTRGHILLVPRVHCEKLADVGVGVGREIGQWLPVVSRVVMRVLFGDGEEEEEEEKGDWCWNVVQNNGVRAAQQVPHVHFHVIPRPPDRPATGPGKAHMSYVMFGRGQREDLDDEEGEVLARLLREELAREVQRVKREEGVDLEGEFGVDNAKGKL